MIKELGYGTIATFLVVVSYNILYGPLLRMMDVFDTAGAPSNILDHATFSFSMGFLGLLAGIILFIVLRATRKEYDSGNE
jgi:hypothetical protein